MSAAPANSSAKFDISAALTQLSAAETNQQITPAAAKNIHAWLTEPRYTTYAPAVAAHLAEGKFKQLDDAFWTVIPFGTGGRRGRMYPIGSNAINDRTIGESAQGLAQYVKESLAGQPLSCAIAYDPRHNSRHFAELCASIMVANGFTVYFLDDYRSTPALSFTVRHKQASCGIMVTASHNPPSDNAVKVYWSDGAQVMPPHDKAIIDRVMSVGDIPQANFADALKEGKIKIVTAEIDAAITAEHKKHGLAGPRDAKIIFSPLHGVGASVVIPALAADGFKDVELYAPHAEPNGDFPNVPGHVSNPENTIVFDAIIERAKTAQADVILVTDPDCDRLGVAAPIAANRAGAWGTFTGNQIAALLTDYVLEQRKKSGMLSPEHYVVKTLVTTEMARRIADSYGVKTFGDLLVGFKWIAAAMDQQGPEKFVIGMEESHGYLVGQYARDKDGAVAAMLMAELAASLKAKKQTLHDKMASLYWQHGFHLERLVNKQMEGSQGMTLMLKLMEKLRVAPPKQLAGIPVAKVRDYFDLKTLYADGTIGLLDGPRGDMVFLDLAEEGNYVAVRPSGTEPKVKFYMFSYIPPEQLSDLELAKDQLSKRMDGVAADLSAFAATVC